MAHPLNTTALPPPPAPQTALPLSSFPQTSFPPPPAPQLPPSQAVPSRTLSLPNTPLRAGSSQLHAPDAPHRPTFHRPLPQAPHSSSPHSQVSPFRLDSRREHPVVDAQAPPPPQPHSQQHYPFPGYPSPALHLPPTLSVQLRGEGKEDAKEVIKALDQHIRGHPYFRQFPDYARWWAQMHLCGPALDWST
ncbi:hypothetical protein B9479_008255, partial [Cryptococcus floricola]